MMMMVTKVDIRPNSKPLSLLKSSMHPYSWCLFGLIPVWEFVTYNNRHRWTEIRKILPILPV